MEIDSPADVVVKDQNGNELPCRITRVEADAVDVWLIEVTLCDKPIRYTPEIEETIKARLR